MSKLDLPELRGLPRELGDWSDKVSEIINFGKYQFPNIDNDRPFWTGRRGESILVYPDDGPVGILYIAPTDLTKNWIPVASRSVVVNDAIDGSVITLDAKIGEVFNITLVGNRTIGPPSNAVDGLKLILRITADGGTFTPTPATGPGGFRFGTDITGWDAITDGVTDHIGCIFMSKFGTWEVVAYVRGYS